jgi:agmatine deiminase
MVSHRLLTVPPPGNQGWRMPAEWEPHEATWIGWPHNCHDWPGKFTAIPWVFGEVVRQLQHGEKVHILVNDPAQEKRARALLDRVGALLGKQVRFFRLLTDRCWLRDTGPIFVKSRTGHVGCTTWQFNAWAKYDDWQRDCLVAGKIAGKLDLPAWQARFQDRKVVLEGGSIDVNGAGLLLTTEECLLSPVQARNPDLQRRDIEQVLEQYLGINKVLWLNRGIDGDDTHGHVDDLARFVGPSTIVTVVEANRDDPNHEPLQENLRRLHEMTDLAGRKFEVVELPMPAPLIFAGRRLPASYANFYVANERVLVPTFNDPADRLALGILADLFPGRQVVGIHAVDLVWGLGTLHCMTQQQPAVVVDSSEDGCRR